MHTNDIPNTLDPVDGQRSIGLVRTIGLLAISSGIALLGNWIVTKVSPLEALPGILVLCAISMIALGLGKLVPLKIPVVAWVSLVAVIVSIPGVTGSAALLELVNKVNFLALATPVLAYAGLALSPQEFSLARRAGWKIAIVAICVMLGTYLGSAIVADLALRILG